MRGPVQTLSSGEAAALLGVSRQTLYAYVSRGLIAPVERGGQAGSRYARSAVEELAKTRRRGRRPREIARATLDWGVPVLETSITRIEAGALSYRGRDALALAATATWEEVAALLWQMPLASVFPDSAPAAPPAPFVGQADAEVLLARFATAAPGDDTAGWQQAPDRLAQGCGALIRLIAAAALGTAPRATPLHLQCADAWGLDAEAADRVRAALVLCADHELNVSGFTARCIASAGASLKAALVGALAALSGARHGGSTARVEAVWRMLESAPDISSAVRDALAGGMEMPGFGHPLYPSGDIRAKAILAAVGPRLPAALAIAEAVHDLTGRAPNLDFALVALRRDLGLPEGSAFLIFAFGRAAGWIAHALEQRASGTLIRPRAVYVGPRFDPADDADAGA
ncbi:excisionase [Acuticoccus sediminis]|uniref:citrate synthase (unknown stereospecificity) n=1 Tax=Acuticoccus sediminis TaxID=2184697 RepID=A0A8B2NJG9_9HYPH|nr:citrate synthase family protein [Acuticoccus sediminis]RAH95328.1 excisionase [Acuticoccus sediminis]